jgi:hypothetical protein
MDHRVRAEQAVEKAVMFVGVAIAIAIGRASLAARVGLAHVAAVLAVTRDTDVRFLATITSGFDLLHFANHVTHLLTMSLAAAVIAAAITGIVVGQQKTWTGQQCGHE